MKKLILTFAAMVAMTGAAFGADAPAQTQCMPWTKIAEVAKEKHYRTKVLAVINPERAVAVLTTEDNSKWSMVMLSPLGIACVMAEGTDWMDTPKKFEGPQI